MIENIPNYLSNISALTYMIVFTTGVVTSFTPCVYPLIPIIVGVIGATKQESKLRNFILSLSYVIGVAFTFSVLGIFAAITGRLFGQIQSSPIAHLIVGNIIILFGLAMLDVITLPIFLLNRIGAGRTVKGASALSALFMGAISGFVAAPCTTAVLGALLAYVAATQNVVIGFSLLFTFALGLGTLLVIVGTFTGILLALEKKEKFMYAAQKIIGFLMILLGEYFIFRAGLLSI